MAKEYLVVTNACDTDGQLQEFQDRLNDHAAREGFELREMVLADTPGSTSSRLIAVMGREAPRKVPRRHRQLGA